MATLPRYQQMGIQYADLPRLSTAGLEVGAKAMNVLGSQIDRMTNFVYEQGITEAQRKAQKYAVQNPLTKSQIDTALGTGQGLQVPGAGRIFQQTYEKAQASLLSTELQIEGKKKLAAVTTAIEAGMPIDLRSIETEINDMIDGFSSTVMALDPDTGLRFKASMATAGSAIFEKAAAQAIKMQREQLDAEFANAVEISAPVLEAIVAKSGAIDAETGQPVDIERLIDLERQPFLESVRLTGSNKHLLEFNKTVAKAKQGALVSFMTDRDQVPDAAAAMDRIVRQDMGNLTPIFKGLTQAERKAVRDGVIDFYADEYTAKEQARKARDNEAKEKWTALSIEFLRPNTGSARKRQIAFEGVALNQLTLQQAEDMLKPPAEKTDPVLYNQLFDQIKRGVISSSQDLLPYKGSLSDSDFMALGNAATNTQGTIAVRNMNNFVGINENAWVPDDKAAKRSVISGFYTEELGKQVKNDQGVLVYQTPTEAMDKAIVRFEADKAAQKVEKQQERLREDVEEAFEKRGVPLPNQPLGHMDLNSISDSALRTIVENKQKSYNELTRSLQNR
jgi:hypothetical protein